MSAMNEWMKYDEICDDSLDNLTAVIRDIFNLTETSIAYSYDHLLTIYLPVNIFR